MSLIEQINKKLEKIDYRIEKIKERLDKQEKRIISIQKQIDTIKTKSRHMIFEEELTREDAIWLTKEMWGKIEVILANNTEEELLKEGVWKYCRYKRNNLRRKCTFY